jgi:hypothetical protein
MYHPSHHPRLFHYLIIGPIFRNKKLMTIRNISLIIKIILVLCTNQFTIFITKTAQQQIGNCKKRLLASSCLSVPTEQFGSYWTDFHETWYLSIFRKHVGKIPVSFTSDRNGGHLNINIHLWSPAVPLFFRIRKVADKTFREKHTFYVLVTFLENRAVCATTWKSILRAW